MTNPRYRWSSPAEWLEEYLTTQDEAGCRQVARELLGHVDSDQIQESFQSDMDQAGYFRDLNTCPDCASPLTDRTTNGRYPSYCDTCDREVEDDE